MESRTFQNSTGRSTTTSGINNFVERETKEKELFILLTEITIRVKPSYWEAFQKAPSPCSNAIPFDCLRSNIARKDVLTTK